MHSGPFKNIVDAVRDWVNNKEEQYLPGEIYESVPNEVIKMLWEGDTKFDDLTPVSGAKELTPVSKLDNYLHFIKIFYDIEKIKQNALTFTNIGDEDESFRFHLEYWPETLPTLFLIDGDDLVPFELDEFYTIPAHSEIKIVGYNPTGEVGLYSSRYFSDWSGNSNINISGKLTSLIDIVGQLDTLPDTADFSGLFRDAPVKDASGLIFPNNVTSTCYANMFQGCTSLTTAPKLPATELADMCYNSMFSGCSSLTTAPTLPATELADMCYISMFRGCTSLKIAPELPATELAELCYFQMFQDCTSLTTAPELPATELVKGCYQGMFVSCTSLTTAPELPATELVKGCYQGMFYRCRNLNYIKCLAVNGIGLGGSTSNWVRNVSSTGTFIKHPDATEDWVRGNNGIPVNWTVKDDGEDFVDLGLSVKWAKNNIGANPGSTPESYYGNYYAWGETGTKEDYSWSTYQHCTSSYNPKTGEGSLTKYTGSDDKVVLEAVDDVATTTYGSDCRMPTQEELEELLSLPNQWVENYNDIEGLNGRVFTGTNGNTLFIPAAGSREGSKIGGVGSDCHLISSSLLLSRPRGAYRLYFNSNFISIDGSDRSYGFSVRAVKA